MEQAQVGGVVGTPAPTVLSRTVPAAGSRATPAPRTPLLKYNLLHSELLQLPKQDRAWVIRLSALEGGSVWPPLLQKGSVHRFPRLSPADNDPKLGALGTESCLGAGQDRRL